MGSVAKALAQTLKAYETEHFFLLTGGDQDFWIALRDAGIKMWLARSERSAVYMADAYARLTYKPAFTYGQWGPGAACLVGGLVDPHWAGAPVVAITSAVNTKTKGKSEYQELDHMPLFQPITKFNMELPRADRAAEVLRNAIRAAVSGNPGPAHLDVPMDMFVADAGEQEIYAEEAFKRYPSHRVRPQPEDIEAAARIMAEAKKPVILAGTGVVNSQAWDELIRLAETLNWPVATTMGGKGSIPENHPNAVGVAGRYSRKSANDILRQADVVLAVGCTLGALATDTFQMPSPEARIIHVDIDPRALGTGYREAVSIEADARMAVEALREALGSPSARPWEVGWTRQVQGRTTEWRQAYEEAANSTRAGAINPAAVLQSVSNLTRPGDVVVADTGYMGAWAGALYELKEAGRNFIRTGGSLGWALPAALGAQVARPQGRIIAISGDGGIGYHIGDMETAVRMNLPIIVVLLNNRSLAFEYHIQKLLYNNTIVESVNDFSDANYAEVARAFGWHGQRVEEAGQIEGALRAALDSGKPAMVEVIVDKEIPAPVTYYENIIKRSL